MEELIRKNKRNSAIMLGLTFLILLLVGYVLGDWLYSYAPVRRTPDYAQKRMLFALAVAGFFGFIQLVRTYFIFHSRPRLLFKMLNMKEADPEKFRKLYNVTAEMSIAAGLSRPPQVYIIPYKALNAMAFGTHPEKSAIAVTAGLLSVCNRDELQGVVAHEMSHIVNRDCLFLDVCRSTLGMVIVMRDVLFRSIYFGGLSGGGYRSSASGRSKSSKSHSLFLLLGIIFALIAPVLIQVIYFALSREREYLADAESARLTRYPAGLASALSKIAYSSQSLDKIDKVTSASFIDQPYGDVIITSRGTRTHPPIWKRITILRNMAGGAGFINYKKAYNEVMQNKADFMPVSMSADKSSIPLRNALALAGEPELVTSPEEYKKQENDTRSEDIIRLSENFGFINCPCGLKIKIPPDYKKPQFKCPRCGRIHVLRDKLRNTLSSMLEDKENLDDNEMDEENSENIGLQIYHRKTAGREVFNCRCGSKVTISSTFIGNFIHCTTCKKKIIIK